MRYVCSGVLARGCDCLGCMHKCIGVCFHSEICVSKGAQQTITRAVIRPHVADAPRNFPKGFPARNGTAGEPAREQVLVPVLGYGGREATAPFTNTPLTLAYEKVPRRN